MITMHRLLVPLLAVAALGCAGAGAGPARRKAPLGEVTARTSEPWAELRHEGQYRVQNNLWNTTGTAGRQEVFLETLDGAPAFGWSWAWRPTPAGKVVASPEVIYGTKPWDGSSGAPGPATPFPLHPGAAAITVELDATIAARGVYDTAFTLWCVSALPAGRPSLSHEIMIWLVRSGLQPAGARRGTHEVDGHRFELWVKPGHGDSTNPERWTYVAFSPKDDLTTPANGARRLRGPFHLEAFLDVLVREGVLPASAYVTSVELQNEVAESSGTTEVRRFSVQVTPRGQAGDHDSRTERGVGDPAKQEEGRSPRAT